MAKLQSSDDKVKYLRVSSKLKGKDIYIIDDVSAATMAIRRTKLDEIKAKRSEENITYFSGAKLITKRRPHQQQRNAGTGSITVPIITVQQVHTTDAMGSTYAVVTNGATGQTTARITKY